MADRSRVRLRGLVLLAALVLGAVGCPSKDKTLPSDPQLESYIRISAGCALVERSFSDDPDLYGREMAAINLPEDWKSRLDSLVAVHGADARFWYRVYTEILERSRG
ncbi:MAG: hypothetical protein WAW06_03140 [bacterium]